MANKYKMLTSFLASTSTKLYLYTIYCLEFDPEFVSLPAVGPVTAGVVDISREYGETAYSIPLLFLSLILGAKHLYISVLFQIY